MKGQRLGLSFPQRIDSAQLISQGTTGAVVVPAAIHFWPMNEGTGASFVDHIGTNNMTATNVTWAVTSGLGAAAVAQFNGSASAAATFNADMNFDITSNFSVSFWFNATALGGALIGDVNPSFAGWSFDTAANLRFITPNGAVGAPSQAVSTGSAIHVVGTYAFSSGNAVISLYVNGVRVSQTSGAQSGSFASGNPVLVGNWAASSLFFSGAMAFTRVWNVAINGPQVAKLFSSGPQ